MQVSVETTSALERQMTITVPAARIEEDVNSRLKQTASSARIDGFRPGKVPFKVIKSRYGKGVRAEVLGEVIQKSFYEAVTQEKLKPAGGPTVEPKVDEEGKDFEFTATFEVYPEIEAADFSAVEIAKPVAEVTDQDVEETIQTLLKQHADWKEVDRAAQDGDQVNIAFEGFKDGEPFEGGKAESHDLVIGSNTMIPGFEEGITGMKAGDEKELDITFPDDYQAENLAGQPVVFKIKANTVSEPITPALNKELFAKFGVDVETEAEFREEVRKNMEREVKNALKTKLKNRVFGKLIDVSEIEIPKALIKGESERLRDQAIQQFGGGMQIDAETIPLDIFEDQARRRVSIGLLITDYIEKNELKPDDARVQAWIEETASSYETPQDVINFYNTPEQRQQVESLMLEDQVLDALLDQAKVTEEKLGYKEAVEPENPGADAEEEDEASENA